MNYLYELVIILYHAFRFIILTVKNSYLVKKLQKRRLIVRCLMIKMNLILIKTVIAMIVLMKHSFRTMTIRMYYQKGKCLCLKK